MYVCVSLRTNLDGCCHSDAWDYSCIHMRLHRFMTLVLQESLGTHTCMYNVCVPITIIWGIASGKFVTVHTKIDHNHVAKVSIAFHIYKNSANLEQIALLFAGNQDTSLIRTLHWSVVRTPH